MDAERWCLGCGAGLRTVMTVGGRRRELETTPHPDGNHIMRLVPVVGGGRGWRARVLTGAELPAQQAAHRMHHCPGVKQPKGPLCIVCHQPMTRDIALQLGWTTHPGCDLDEET